MAWVEYRPGLEAEVLRDVLPVAKSFLMCLVGNRVSAAKRTERGGLTLAFENGGFVSVDDDSPQYECFSIATPDGEIFV